MGITAWINQSVHDRLWVPLACRQLCQLPRIPLQMTRMPGQGAAGLSVYADLQPGVSSQWDGSRRKCSSSSRHPCQRASPLPITEGRGRDPQLLSHVPNEIPQRQSERCLHHSHSKSWKELHKAPPGQVLRAQGPTPVSWTHGQGALPPSLPPSLVPSCGEEGGPLGTRWWEQGAGSHGETSPWAPSVPLVLVGVSHAEHKPRSGPHCSAPGRCRQRRRRDRTRNRDPQALPWRPRHAMEPAVGRRSGSFFYSLLFPNHDPAMEAVFSCSGTQQALLAPLEAPPWHSRVRSVFRACA